jgi:hypothetical protein
LRANDRRTIACNGAGGRVGFEINAYRAGPLMRVVRHVEFCMHWSLVRPDERCAARLIQQVGGSFTLAGPWPFVSHINSLWVRETSIQDDQLVSLGELSDLEGAELGYTNLSDGGITGLPRYRRLKYIFLWGTRITDTSLETLTQMPWLRLVNVSQTAITHGGFKTLCTLLPNCLISHTEFGVCFRNSTGPEARGAWARSGEQRDAQESR